MIFATVGSQESFDRLIRAVDEWAILRGRDDVFAQIGGSTLQPKHIKFTKFLEPNEFNRVIREASVIVAHAGMGSIISALELGKPLVVMPRLDAGTALDLVERERATGIVGWPAFTQSDPIVLPICPPPMMPIFSGVVV